NYASHVREHNILHYIPTRRSSDLEIGETLKDMNVDIVNMANNHVMDKGEKGILAAIKNWEKLNMPYVGAYKSEEDRNTLRIFHKDRKSTRLNSSHVSSTYAVFCMT